MDPRTQRVPLQSEAADILWPKHQSRFPNIHSLSTLHKKIEMAPLMAASESSLSQTNLISLLSRVIRLQDQRNATDIWYLDFSKPFDNCS